MRLLAVWAVVAVAVSVLCVSTVVAHSHEPHADNWVLLVCTSRYWFNYRHVSNVLTMYHTVKELGIPDSHIILMLADDMACNARNPFQSAVYGDASHDDNLYGTSVEVDYRGEEVTVEAVLRLLTARHDASLPASKRLASHAGSNLLVYMSGHGGDGFLKFQDSQEMTAQDLADAVEEMASKGRFREAMLLFDTCEAESLALPLRTPGVAAMGSSRVGENSYAHGSDHSLGLSLSDGFTFAATRLFQSRIRRGQHSDLTVADLMRVVPYHVIRSHAFVRLDLLGRGPQSVLLSDFFAAVSDVFIV